MEKHLHTTRKINSWKKFKAFIDKLSADWIFRGQADSEWELKTTLERTSFYNKSDGMESKFLAQFQRGAKNFLAKKMVPSNLIEWLAMMQHHGAPTRFLDFTRSPYIAAYFAFEELNRPKDRVSVWAGSE